MNKNLAPLCILEILQKYSDSKPPLTQQRIISLLDKNYNIQMERKAVSRNIENLIDAGYTIYSEREKDGNSLVYRIEREFDDSELHLLIDSVLSSRHISSNHTTQLIDKLCKLSNNNFRSHVKNRCSVEQWNKTENKLLFYVIEIVDEAIESNSMVKFTYNRYGADKKLHKTCDHTVSPYQLFLRNQSYYLMAWHEKHKDICYFHVDRITNIEILEGSSATPLSSHKGYQNGIDYRTISTAMPYMFNDTPEKVMFYADEGILNQVVEWFGDNAVITQSDGRIRVSVNVSLMAMEYWVLQFINHIEIISPESFKNTIIADLKSALDKYNA